ncbi:hypothetical protein B4N89_37250 [Embleya scabrispora]|uniref:STAS domain-containing protein n=1 Tax=Embleya scabrispora TaxID=159449 RepID=A0A1T3NMG2_9ACTN|nr:STAS domain-containing protein [Embleya scabrispora]OPC77900.1 hypothetical protein B4N89_37250 [Embleya scabrispora]
MGLTVRHGTDRLVVTLPARVDRRNASAVLDNLMRVLNVPTGRDCREVVLDLRETAFLDESGPWILSAVRRGAGLLHMHVSYEAADAHTRDVATEAGLAPTVDSNRPDLTLAAS